MEYEKYLDSELIIDFSEFNKQWVFLHLLLNRSEDLPTAERNIIRMRLINGKRLIYSTNELMGFQLSFYLFSEISTIPMKKQFQGKEE